MVTKTINKWGSGGGECFVVTRFIANAPLPKKCRSRATQTDVTENGFRDNAIACTTYDEGTNILTSARERSFERKRRIRQTLHHARK